jgi:hypothetical protein
VANDEAGRRCRLHLASINLGQGPVGFGHAPRVA